MTPAPGPAAVASVIAAARAQSIRAIARLVTMVETGGTAAAAVASELIGSARSAQIIGITGAPGAGKSTLTGAVISHLRSRKKPLTVAVLAVDPASPFSGGALLGDRVRMADHALDPGVYIRSMSSRGHLGGLAAATPAAVDLLSALGFDVVIIETVGVGQSEIDIMNLADTVMVVLAPGMGDGVQAAKAGIMEIADILVVNKADHEGADATVRDLRAIGAIDALGAPDGSWAPPIIKTTAFNGSGIPELWGAALSHREFLTDADQLQAREIIRASAAIEAVVAERFRRSLTSAAGSKTLTAAASQVVEGRSDHHQAAKLVVRWLCTTGLQP